MWMIFGQGLKLIIQAIYFVEIARSLGVRNYGAFVSVVALVGIVYPFGSLGGGNLLVKNVARDESLFAVYWGRALALTSAFGVVLIGVVLVLSRCALPREIPLLPHPSALEWGYIYFGCTGVVVAISAVLVLFHLGQPRFEWKSLRSEIREGFYFSASQTSQTIYNDIDKTMLARLSTLDAAGIYGAAYRLIDVSFVPVSAALWSAYPSFFRVGAYGISASLKFAKPLMRRALAYSGAVCALLLVTSNIVPYVLGSEYSATASALRWLSVLPILKALHYFLSDTLTSAGYQGVRTAVQAGVAIFNVLINLWIIPAHFWRGAAWSSIASDALLCVGVGTAVWLVARADERTRRVPELENVTEACAPGVVVGTTIGQEAVPVE